MCEEQRRLIDLYDGYLKAYAEVANAVTKSDWEQPNTKITMQKLDALSADVERGRRELGEHLMAHGCA